MHLVVDMLYLLGLVLASPWLLFRAIRSGRRPELIVRLRLPAVPRGAIWFHGSSVGEVTLIRPLIQMLERERPDLPIVVSSHTATGERAAQAAYPSHTVIRFPFDFSWLQRRLMARMQPAALVVVESDLWPNQLLAAERAQIAVAVINAKLSERSAGLHRWSRIVPRALAGVELVAAQTAAHANRFREIGVDAARLEVTGNMKYDLAADDSDAGQRVELRGQLGIAAEELVIIGGSLHPGEDLDLLAAFAASGKEGARTRLIIVPRYPDQAEQVIANAAAAGFDAIAKSDLDRNAERRLRAEEVLVVDTLGELRRLYAVSDIAFVGGSLYYRGANKGGHNLMEPAILGLPVLFGPHNFSFRETVADLLAADAGIIVHDRAELTAAIVGLVDSAARRDELGQRGRRVILDGQGASLRNLNLLLTLVDRTSGCSANAEAPQSRQQPQGHVLNE